MGVLRCEHKIDNSHHQPKETSPTILQAQQQCTLEAPALHLEPLYSPPRRRPVLSFKNSILSPRHQRTNDLQSPNLPFGHPSLLRLN